MPGIITFCHRFQKSPGQTVSGISLFAKTNVFRGIVTKHSSEPQLASGGKCLAISAVPLQPITAKSPELNSKMSGHPSKAGVRAPFAWGAGPSLLMNIPGFDIPDYYQYIGNNQEFFWAPILW